MDENNSQLYLLSYSGELSIKGRGTRTRFTRRLVRNLTDALESAGIPHEIESTWSRLFLRSPSEGVVEVASRVFGVQSISPVEERDWETLEDLLRTGEEIFPPRVAGKTFAVRARRGPEAQKVPFQSPDIERQLGARLVPHAAGVDLRTPEVTARVELHGRRAFFSSQQHEAAGGLPAGTEGRAVALVSGGFDSIVAAWQMMRRGVILEYLFLNLGGDAHQESVLEVLKVLSDRWSYGHRPSVHMVDFRPLVEELKQVCPQSLWQVILKRQMLRTADQVVRMTRSVAIITGEAVGQVSSQTLQNLAVITRATEIPILRPLVAANKDDIVDFARHIGTYDLSAKVPEYCALASKGPETHAKIQRVEEAEEGLDLERIRQQLNDRAVIDLRALDLDKIRSTNLGVDDVPSGAVVVDLRTPAAFKGWHYPEAVLLDYRKAQSIYRSFSREKMYFFYCEVGLKSAHLAELVHRAEGHACYFNGGLRRLMRHVEGQDEALHALRSPVLLGD
jgi:thiamine biosynthesis protein ThiI